MTIENLNIIKKELKRFKKRLKDCKKRSDENLGWKTLNGEIIGVGNVSGIKESGALKRAALDLKRVLTENCK